MGPVLWCSGLGPTYNSGVACWSTESTLGCFVSDPVPFWCLQEGSKGWPRCLGPCQPHCTPRWSSWLLDLVWPTMVVVVTWSMDQWREYLSDALCLSFSPSPPSILLLLIDQINLEGEKTLQWVLPFCSFTWKMFGLGRLFLRDMNGMEAWAGPPASSPWVCPLRICYRICSAIRHVSGGFPAFLWAWSQCGSPGRLAPR